MRQDVVVVGGGVMGLMTAYHASARGRVTVLERGRIGDPMTASYGRTRSYRSDYLDPQYARLAQEAQRLWKSFEAETASTLLVRCGCMNIASSAVTPNLADTYAHRSHEVLTGLGLPTESLDAPALRARFPYLNADLAHVDLGGGVVNLRATADVLLRVLAERGVRIVEGADVQHVAGDHVVTDTERIAARAVVVTAGHGSNDVLARTGGARLHAPITRDRPVEARYFTPTDPVPFRAGAMPVIAYLDAGIYCHPIVDGLIDKVKIGYYHPPDLPRTDTPIDGIDAFVELCLPGLRGAASEPVTDTDGCDYDLVADDDFVLGPVPGTDNVHVGVGWRGTGYKFAPWVGRVLAELALEGGTVYDIDRFAPGRFTEGGAGDDATVDPDPEAASV
jgi:sarcosine oxidase